MMSAGWWRGVLWLLLVGLGLYVFTRITSTLTVFGLGFVIAYLLNSPVEKITGQKLGPIKSLSRGQAILVVYLFLFALLTGGGFLIIPLAIEQTQEMVREAPEMVARIQTKALELQERYIHSVPPSVRSSVESTIAGSADRFGSMLGTVLSFLASAVLDLVGKIFLLLTGLLVALYFLLNWQGLFDAALGLVPRKYKDDARSLTLQMNRIFGGYIRATIVASSACGVLTFVLLMLLTGWHPNPYTLLLALLAALTYPIPVVGAAGTCVLGGVLAFLSTGDLGYAVVVLLVIMGANQGVDRTIYPKLMGDAIGVSPMFILFAAFAGGEFLGTTGMLLGIPLAAMTKALLTWVHARFLVVPEEQQKQSTEELWARAPAKAGQATPAAREVWDDAASQTVKPGGSAEATTSASQPASRVIEPVGQAGAASPGAVEQAGAAAPASAAVLSVEQAGQARAPVEQAGTAAPASAAVLSVEQAGQAGAAVEQAGTAAPAGAAGPTTVEQVGTAAPASAAGPSAVEQAGTAVPAGAAGPSTVEQAGTAAPAGSAGPGAVEQAGTAAPAGSAGPGAVEQAGIAAPAGSAGTIAVEQAGTAAPVSSAGANTVEQAGQASAAGPSAEQAGSAAQTDVPAVSASSWTTSSDPAQADGKASPVDGRESSSGPAGQAASPKRGRRSKKDAPSEHPGDEDGGIVGMIG